MSTQTYKVGKQNQIIDLNGSSVNFDINFSINSRNGEPFYAVVIDQESLDTGKELEYKFADKGMLSANLISDKNIYKNYNLIVRADKPCEIEVFIDKKLINPNLPPPPQLQKNSYNKPHLVKKKGINWKTIILILVIVIGCGLLLYFYFKGDGKKKEKNIEKDSTVKISEAPEISSPLSTYSNNSSLSKAIDDISPSP